MISGKKLSCISVVEMEVKNDRKKDWSNHPLFWED